MIEHLIERNGRLGVMVDGRFRPALAGATGVETIVIIAAVAAVAAAGIGAYATYQQSEAQAKAMKYNAKVAENQAIAAQQQAAFVAKQQREQTRRVLARQRALYGTAGVEIAAGSPLLVMADSAEQGELNAQATLSGGAARAMGFQAQAGLDRFMARQAQTAGALGAGATLLGGVASAAGAYGNYAGTNPGGGIRVPYSDTSSGLGGSYYSAGGGYYM